MSICCSNRCWRWLFILPLAFWVSIFGHAQTQFECGQSYVVQPGDTLSTIAVRAYGSNAYMTHLWRANQATIGHNVNQLLAGSILSIPCIEQQQAQEQDDQSQQPKHEQRHQRASLPPLSEFIFLARSAPPYSMKSQPAGGLVPHLLQVALSGQVDAVRILNLAQDPNSSETLLQENAFDIGIPWFKPDCHHQTQQPKHQQCQGLRFSKPIINTRIVFWKHVQDPFIFHDNDDMAGKKICRSAAWGSDDLDRADRLWLTEQHVVVVQPQQIADCFQLLLKNDVDFVADHELSSRLAIATLGFADRVTTVPELTTTRPIYALVPARRPNADDILQIVNQGLQSIQKSGVADAITQYHTTLWYQHYAQLLSKKSLYPTPNTKKIIANPYELADPLLRPALVFIAGGCFTMGSPDTEYERAADEQLHEVCVDDFWIGQYEITQAQWQRVMGVNPAYFSGCDRCPVEQVSWAQIQLYLSRLNALTGRHYRLPTEAEWEYAARAHSNTVFHTGNCIHSLQANYNGQFKPYTDCNDDAHIYLNKTQPVGAYRPNAWGLYDIHGNVYEWTCSVYQFAYDGQTELQCAAANAEANRVVRGGSWYSYPWKLRLADRSKSAPDTKRYNIGFRVVLDASAL
jgi:formylglycine-generating enzyme required for sulfatase activity